MALVGWPGKFHLPATRPVTAGRGALTHLDPSRVDPVSCLEGLRGQLSPRPENLIPFHPFQLAAAAVSEPSTTPVSGCQISSRWTR